MAHDHDHSPPAWLAGAAAPAGSHRLAEHRAGDDRSPHPEAALSQTKPFSVAAGALPARSNARVGLTDKLFRLLAAAAVLE